MVVDFLENMALFLIGITLGRFWDRKIQFRKARRKLEDNEHN